MGLKSKGEVLIRHSDESEEKTKTQGESHMTTKAEIEVIPPEAGEARKGSLLEPSKGP